MNPPTIPIGKSITVTVVAVDAATPPVEAPGSSTVTFTFTNPSGNVSAAVVFNPPDPPAAINFTYSAPA